MPIGNDGNTCLSVLERIALLLPVFLGNLNVLIILLLVNDNSLSFSEQIMRRFVEKPTKRGDAYCRAAHIVNFGRQIYFFL